MKTSLRAPTICQSNPYLTTKISTLRIKVRSDLVVWYNFWENMPSCLTFGSLVATAILFDFDLDERINPNAYMLKLSVHPPVHVRMCLFVWCVAKITTEVFSANFSSTLKRLNKKSENTCVCVCKRERERFRFERCPKRFCRLCCT